MTRKLSPALEKLIASFKQGLPEKFAEIEALHIEDAAGNDEALQAYYTAVHRLAGSAGSYGFPEVSKTARVLDRYLSDAIAGDASYDAKQARQLLQDLNNRINEAAQA